MTPPFEMVQHTVGAGLLALTLGAIIGAERQWRRHPAGLHTNALVALGAAAFSSLPEFVSGGDPMRIAGQVVVGVGFLCAGLIWRNQETVRGLNTAATVWCSAAVGVFCGVGAFAAAAALATLVLFANILLHAVEATAFGKTDAPGQSDGPHQPGK